MSDDTNPKDLLGVKKVRLDTVPPASMIYQALAMEYGADRYGYYNWREKKVRTSVYTAAGLRHFLRYMDGEDTDPESGKPHIGHILACMGILADATETGNLVDDRPKPGAASLLIEKWKKA